MAKKPQPNHRAVLNAIRAISKKKLPMSQPIDLTRGDGIAEGMAAIISRMEFTEGHEQIIREFNNLCHELRAPAGYVVEDALRRQLVRTKT